MNENTDQLEHWNAIAVDELPDRFPDNVDPDDGPFGWKNTNTDTVLHIDYDTESNEWIVTGGNSIVATAGELSTVKSDAREYMHDHPRPSPMVG